MSNIGANSIYLKLICIFCVLRNSKYDHTHLTLV